MAVIRSKEFLLSLQVQTENQLTLAINSWQNLSSSLLDVSPAPGKWSAAQCIEHLNIYCRYYLPAIEKAILKALSQKQKTSDQFKSGWLGDYFVRLMQKDPSKNPKDKMKAPKNALPPSTLNTAAVVAEFIDHLEKMQQLIEKANWIDINKTRVGISIARFIKLKLGDVLAFNVAHTQRHLMQAERAISSARSSFNSPVLV